ncbi:MAG: 2-oxoacid:acceptor oxidoreductase subunit alpha [candidate division WOR-3 bacterium]|nr:2-oxoacid:acceptor oxidoreductase subunit alpha [candidate division WOR-3 bacterium]MCX7757454.1 2-oxoacid:acceptor oxidoreductase subunit alpha [candidate division WOR-3 bacterium]MDW7987905.1 2-oxoacid:acceptor oxidoreductase subunit alpha [candidate division WOR-3 bacterium]
MQLLSGNEATALGALKAGVRFFAGYPITPSTEIAEVMAEELPKVGGIFIQMEDEIASICAVIGAGASGMRAMTATSGPGFSLMQEGIGYAVMAEVPCIIVNVQRGGPATGLPTKVSQADVMAARWGTHGDHPIVALAPYSVLESFELTVKAVEFSLRLRMPVIILSDEIIGHMREVVKLPEEVTIYSPPPLTKSRDEYYHYDDDTNFDAPYAHFGQGYRIHLTGLTHRKDGFPTNDPKIIKWKLDRLLEKITKNREWLHLVDYQDLDSDTVIVSYGSSARSALEAKFEYEQRHNKKIGFLRLITIWPFHYQKLQSLLKNAKRVIVVEMNQGQMTREISRVIKHNAELINVNRYDGELITPEEILAVL